MVSVVAIFHNVYRRIIFILLKIHAKVFRYIYDTKTWIIKHVIVP